MAYFELPDLVALYSRSYDADQVRWRVHGARNKAANIAALVTPYRNEISSVLDVGCGTGHVLAGMKEKGIGSTFVGLEIGTERGVADPCVLGHDVTIASFDGRAIPYSDATFDLVYATHVLEHVFDPRGFLSELRRVAKRFVVVEVPCELHVRTTYRALQTSLDIGHINSFTPESFALMLETSGLTILAMRAFEPSAYLRGGRVSRVLQRTKSLLRRGVLSVSPSVAHRLFTYHVAALCNLGPSLAL